jgi:RNA polymerase sigma-70 factor, ECF subfamily
LRLWRVTRGNSVFGLDSFRLLACHVYVRWPGRSTRLSQRELSAEDVRRLYDQHGPALVAYACSFVVDAGIAEDVVHQIFLKLLRRPVLVPDVPVAYLYRAVRNAALNIRRDGLREAPLPLNDSWFVHGAGDKEAALALQAALRDLPDEQREVVAMRIWSGMTLDEIAVATGVPLNTAASRYRYALEKLRERLKPYQNSDEEK